MKNLEDSNKQKIISKYFERSSKKHHIRSTNIDVLLNRVKNNQKNELKKKLFFSAATSLGIFLFAIIIF